jgi:hypothetical protein
MNVPFQTTWLIPYEFEISGVYRQHFATREKYQDAAVLSFKRTAA